MTDNFFLALRSVDDIIVLLPKGYVNDLGAERLEEANEQYMSKGHKKFVINFTDMYFINSIGASVITGIVQKNLEQNGSLCFTNMKRVHYDVFEMLGITKHVRVFKEEGEALRYLKDRS